MKTISFLIGFLALTACADKSPFQPLKGANFFEAPIRPRIYLKREDRLIDIPRLNRSGIVLSLSDRIVFFNKEKVLSGPAAAGLIISEKETSAVPALLDNLDNFKTVEDLKIKISSFCSYTALADKAEGESASLPQTNRAFQEFASRSYHPSFAIVDLLPEEILQFGLDKRFYCSFLFAFKGKEGVFNYYNIAQQSVEPSFSAGQPNKLSLIRESASGQYAPIHRKAITAQDVGKIFLMNNTGAAAESYHLFCGGLKALEISGLKAESAPVFLDLIGSKERENWPEGERNCRFFSKSADKKITGMTGSFALNFENLGFYKESKIDLSQVKAPQLVSIPSYNGEGLAKLNSYMHFKNLRQLSKSYQDYLSVDVKASSLCFDKNNDPEINLFGPSAEAAQQSLTFPLREKFSIMAVTPKKLFQMGAAYDKWLSAAQDIDKIEVLDPYPIVGGHKVFMGHLLQQIGSDGGWFVRLNSYKGGLFDYIRGFLNRVVCVYNISLRDSRRPENQIEFEGQRYSIEWTREAYGALANFFSSEGPFISADSQRESGRDSYYSLWRIQRDAKARLNINFFDVRIDFSDEAEGYDLDRLSMICRNSGTTGNQIKALERSWPYDPGKRSFLLKTAFSDTKVERFIHAQKKAICRLALYEGDMLRYFSGEMRVKK